MLFESLTSAERKALSGVGSGLFLSLFPGDSEVAAGLILLSSRPLGVCLDFLFRSSLEFSPHLPTQSY